ncbi:transporter [Halospeciosus flavus]|uniref:Transporter n=1 Tax=Halospeciosus flavus TaxID=3032283 RepID=A0ABD5Z3L9_9EURY|nr:transporter [Halospeciosus flavus]
MAIGTTVSAAVHLLFAGLWTGAVVFVTYAVLPTAVKGQIGTDPLEAIVSKLTTLSRASAFLLLVTGGHLAGTRYTVASLTGTGRGHLVLTMVVLWLALAALVEVAAARMRDGLELDKVRTPAENAQSIFRAASLVAVLLLVDAGLLMGGL